MSTVWEERDRNNSELYGWVLMLSRLLELEDYEGAKEILKKLEQKLDDKK